MLHNASENVPFFLLSSDLFGNSFALFPPIDLEIFSEINQIWENRFVEIFSRFNLVRFDSFSRNLKYFFINYSIDSCIMKMCYQ